ncbi:MAG: type II toxin-antitoxin system ParD family antitoxin [Thermomicrobiales bacterium]
MNVNLTPQLEAIIRKKVESGMYGNASEVVREAIRLMDREDRLNRLRAAIDLADQQVETGEITVWTADSMQELLTEADEEDRLGLPIADDVQP